MKWYNGGIAEAITVAKLKSSIFVVYVEGKDETSVQFTQLIEQPELANVLESDKFVAIKIEADSVPHQQFGEIYQNIAVPSLYFIGKNGQPLDIIKEVADVATMTSRIDKVIVVGLGVSASHVEESTTNFLSGEQQSSSVPPNDVVCENGVCTLKREEPTTLSAAEKLARAKELVEKQNLVKAAEEKERLKQKEIERRKLGQEVQQMKRLQEDQELRQLKEEREKEKRESQEARQRVLNQIAQDKAERASRFASSSSNQQPQASTSGGSPPETRAKTNSDTARLQFKLPDGSSKTNNFPSSDTLQTVRTYIANNLNLTCSTYTLATTFPRREFTEDDDATTLFDLHLTPNAVILILPLNRGTVSTNQGSGMTGMFWSLMAPFVGMFNFLKLFLFGSDEAQGNQGSAGSYSANRGPNTVFHVRNKYDFNSKLSSAGSRLVVVDFFATWCGPCKMIAPRLDELARDYRNVVILKVDVDDNRDIAGDYRVSAMPTFVFIKNKRVVHQFSGADYQQIRDTINRYK